MAYADPSDPRLLAKRRADYRKNKAAYKRRSRERKRAMLEFIAEVKSVPCADCGRSYPPYVMDFDHRDPATKVSTVGRIIVDHASWTRLREEVEKCDVVCANCHRERTHGVNVDPVPGAATGPPAKR